MRSALVCFTFLQLVFSQPLFSQSVDTTNSTTSPSRSNLEEADSIARARLLQHIEKNGKSLDDFIAEMKEKERRQQRRLYIRIGAGAALLFVLFFAIARRYKQRSRSPG